MGREALRQVKPGFMRDTLAELQKDGWTIQGTNGGHVRLEHPEADKFIIAPKTASDHRSALNVRADARRAIKMSAEARLLASTTPQLQIPPVFEGPRLDLPGCKSRKRDRWSDAERTRRDLVAAVQAAAPSQSEIDTALQVLNHGATPEQAAECLDRVEAQMEAEAAKLTAGPATGVAAPEAEIPQADVAAAVEPTPITPEASAPAETPAPAASGTVTPSPRRPRRARQTQDRPMLDAAPFDFAPLAAPRPLSPQTVGGLALVDAATLRLALRIVSGEMRQVTITPDMVGTTLAYDGDLILVEAAPTTPAAANALAPRAEAPAAAPAASSERRDEVADAVLRALTTLGDWVANMDLCELLMAEIGRSNHRSANNLIGPALASLRERGLVETREERDGRALKKLHRALPAA